MEQVASGATTTASSATASPAASPQTTPARIRGEKDAKAVSPVTPLQLRRNGFKGRPLINCELVAQDLHTLALQDPLVPVEFPQLAELYDGFVKLGEGSTAVVYKVRRLSDSKDVALKVMRMEHDEERLLLAKNEYELLKHVSHPNIIRALDFFTYAMGAVLVLDYFEGKKLASALPRPARRLDEPVARSLCSQLLGAVAHLHKCGVIHRDVKADNVLVSNDLTDLRLVDFNVAKQLSEGQALTMTGTVDYMPPEVLQGESPSMAGDIWAIGLCLYLMCEGRLPQERRALRITFDPLNEVPQQGSLVRLDGDRWSDTSEPCKEVLRACLELQCDLRPSASAVLAKPWFAEPVDLVA